VADRPLRPATHRCLGGPLPRQLANGPRAPPQVIACKHWPSLVPGPGGPRTLSGISPPFGGLFRARGQVTHVLLTRSPLYRGYCYPFLVRLACVRHAASVRSEPGSNSPIEISRPCGARDYWIARPDVVARSQDNLGRTHVLFSFQRTQLFSKEAHLIEDLPACQDFSWGLSSLDFPAAFIIR
jgi:hypothetical protein